jgi:hypothetical protein
VKQAEQLPSPNFINMELSFNQLNSYLLNFQKVMNQHAYMINNLQQDVSVKIENQDVSPCFQKLSKNFLVSPPKFRMDMERSMQKIETDQKDDLKQSCAMMCNQVRMYGEAISYLYKQNTKREQEIESNQRLLSMKMNKDEVIERDEKNLQRLLKKVLKPSPHTPDQREQLANQHESRRHRHQDLLPHGHF